jgi:hypothetical protein
MSKIEFYSIFFLSASKVSSPSWWLSSMIHDGVMIHAEIHPHFKFKSFDRWMIGRLNAFRGILLLNYVFSISNMMHI